MTCGYEAPHWAHYPDARCIDGYLWDLDSGDDEGLTHGGDVPCPACKTAEYIDGRSRPLHGNARQRRTQRRALVRTVRAWAIGRSTFPCGVASDAALTATPPRAEDLLDALFRENAIPMSDRNGRLYDTIRAALATPGVKGTGFSEFIRNATPEEKDTVYGRVMDKVTEQQQAVIDGVASDAALTATPPRAEDLLDALFRENAIPMSDRNGRLYDTIRAALATPGVSESGHQTFPHDTPMGESKAK